MIKVGVTGGIGTGKSTVCKVLEVLGAPVYYADDRAKELMTKDKTIRKEIIENFGESSYFPDGSLNRKYLAQKVFESEVLTQKLNDIVHYAVGEDFKKWVEEQNSEVVFKEAALMYESGANKQLDKVVLVTCSLETRIERVLKRDPQRDRQQILDIIDRQWPEEKKRELADYIIDNDGEMLVIPQVLEIYCKLRN